MTETQAAQELFDAIQTDGGRTEYGDTALPPKPAEPAPESNQSPPETPVTPEGTQQTPEAPTADEAEPFTKLDPSALPEELQPYYKAMQADYTRKTQGLSEMRKQFEGLGDPDEVRQAAELFRALQTPDGAVRFHQQLSTTLQALGLSPAQADAAATQHMAQQAPQPAPNVQFEDDPEAALRNDYEALRAEMQQMKYQLDAERAQAAQEQQLMAYAGELQRQESIIRDSNPHYTDEDVSAIYELSPFFNGNLIQAQQRYEEISSQAVARVLNSKQQAAATPGIAPVAAPGSAQEPRQFDDIDQAHRAAMEYLRQVEAQG